VSALQVTLDGAPAPYALAMHIEASHARMRLHNRCRVCTSVLYADRAHDPGCPTRALAEVLFGWLGAA
jgi:hypothetical protein